MPAREGLALIAIPILVAVIVWVPPWGFLAVVGVAAAIAGDELIKMARDAGMRTARTLTLLALVGTLAAAWAGGPTAFLVALITAALILPTAQLADRHRPEGALGGVAVALFVVVYIGTAAGCLGWLRQWPADAWGVRFILLFLATIWVGDSGAYYVGRKLGRHKMAPRISPNKTWEGLAGGVIASLAGAAAARVLLGLDLSWQNTLAVGAILAISAPVGDLIESQFKRDMRVKDSSSLLPGHGGFLDRTDSLFFSAPLVLGYLLLMKVLS